MTDERIPLRFIAAGEFGAASPGPEEAILIEAGTPASFMAAVHTLTRPIMRFGAEGSAANFAKGHIPGCTCCGGRGAAATALSELYRSRTLGRVAWFTGVVAVVADPVSVAAEVQADRLTAARFRVLP